MKLRLERSLDGGIVGMEVPPINKYYIHIISCLINDINLYVYIYTYVCVLIIIDFVVFYFIR